MNYNLLWYVWLIWACALIFYWLSGENVLAHRAFSAFILLIIIAGITFKKLLYDKGMTMFKRKGTLFTGTESSTPSSTFNAPESRPLSDEEDDAVVSAATIVSSTSLSADTTMIPDTCSISGEINATGDVHVNGKLEGKIHSEKTIFIMKNGEVEGELSASRIEINGKLKGLCRSRELAINANGFMDGTIECEALSINKHGRFYGISKPYADVKNEVKTPNSGHNDGVSDVDPDFFSEEKIMML